MLAYADVTSRFGGRKFYCPGCRAAGLDTRTARVELQVTGACRRRRGARCTLALTHLMTRLTCATYNNEPLRRRRAPFASAAFRILNSTFTNLRQGHGVSRLLCTVT